MDYQETTKPKSIKTPRIKLVCNECSKVFSVSANASDPSCPRCHGVDWDVQ